MPELPEIEHLKRTLDPLIVGATVQSVDLRRRDVLRSGPLPNKKEIARLLLTGQEIATIKRHGKQLAIIGSRGGVICVHLGMSGQLRFVVGRSRPPKTDHIHCIWQIDGPAGRGRLIFRDPRRFGGLWTFTGMDDLIAQRWSRLGPDALTICPARLASALGATRRSIKAALLDQSMIAGVGNIYADEALFLAGIHPDCRSDMLNEDDVNRLATAIRAVLRRSIRAGGSTLRDYADANGQAGWFRVSHAAYGRAGQPCIHCGEPLRGIALAQRSTVFCPRCQPIREPRTRSVHIAAVKARPCR